MKLTLKIAKAELLNLFYSPIAWFLTIAFMVQCAFSYTTNLNIVATQQEMGGLHLEDMKSVTINIFTNPGEGMFWNIMDNLYLYIPLLTMGIVSREINGGTISLLYSSPVKIREIVYGKYLAMMAYNFILVAVIGLFLVASVFDIQSADYGMLLAAALGFYLLICAYSAIGVFMSSLTSYQIVAAVSTFAMIGILTKIGTLWQEIDFVRDLTYFLSISGRTEYMLRGLIVSKDVIYFIIIIYIFLGLTIYKLQAGRETKPWYISSSRYIAICASALLIGYITSLPKLTGYLDTTATKVMTLTPNSQKIIKEFGEDKLEVTLYNNLLDEYQDLGLPAQRNTYLRRWSTYLRFKPNIEFRYVQYYDTPLAIGYNILNEYNGMTIKQVADLRAKASGLNIAMFKTPEQIRKEIDLKPELNRFVMKLTYRGRSTYLRIFRDMKLWPGEAEVMAAFKRLLQADIPKIGFITDAGQRHLNKMGDREYKTLTSLKTFRHALINQGFDVVPLALNTQEIPANIKALVIADPQRELDLLTTQKVKAYITKGGNLLIAGEPSRQHLLNPLLETLGVQLTNGMLNQRNTEFSPLLVGSYLTKTAFGLWKMLHYPKQDTLSVTMNGVAGLSYRDTMGFHIKPLLMTANGLAYNTMGRNPDLDIVGGNQGSKNLPVSEPQNGKNNKAMMPDHKNTSNDTFTTAVSLTRKINGKQQRIIISGDADFLSNAELNRYNIRTQNLMFSTGLFSWLNYNQYPIDDSRPEGDDKRVTASTDHVALLQLIYRYVLPGLIVLFAVIFFIRRKRK